ncbi:MAG: hypothetical protein Q9212_001750 [Teloschistes hypoglaucus]
MPYDRSFSVNAQASGLIKTVAFTLQSLDKKDHYNLDNGSPCPTLPGLEAARIPMIVDPADTNAAFDLLQSDHAPEYLELFNEPDFSYGGFTPITLPEEAAKNLTKLINSAPKTQLIAPVAAYPGGAWLKQFAGNCTGCVDKIPIVSAHVYDVNPDGVLKQITDLHDQWPDKRIWVTELSLTTTGDNCNTNSYQESDWMKNVVGRIKALGYVDRIFWNTGTWSVYSASYDNFANETPSAGPDKTANLSRARSRVLEAAGRGASLIVLPECFNSPYGCQYFPKYAETLLPSPPSKEKAPSFHALSDLAKETKTYLLGGSIPEYETSSKKYFNTSLMFNPNGELIATHRKVHLFDIDIPGKITFKESEILSPGNKVSLVDLPEYGRIALAICYDIRFPELATIAARKHSFLLLYPGAFNLTTGALHWSLQARARAMDNQVYVGLCSPARDMQASYNAWGHSMVVDPNAAVLCEAGESEEIVYADLTDDTIQQTRKGIPLQTQRRFDVYPDSYIPPPFILPIVNINPSIQLEVALRTVESSSNLHACSMDHCAARTHRADAPRVGDGSRSRCPIQSLLASHDARKPPSAPYSAPIDVVTTEDIDGEAVGFSSARTINLKPACANLSSFRKANPYDFADIYDGPAGQFPESDTGSARRRSVQRDTGDDHNSPESNFSLHQGSVKETGKKSDVDHPRRARSTLIKKTPTFPRRSLYNLKSTSSASPQPTEKHVHHETEEPKLRLNHVPGSYRSDYEFSVRTSRSDSPVSIKEAPPVTVEPLQGRSFEALSTQQVSNSNAGWPNDHAGQPSTLRAGLEEYAEEPRPEAVTPFVRPMLSSNTIREAPQATVPQVDPASQPESLRNVTDRLEGRLLDSAPVEAAEASPHQTETSELDLKSAVPAVDFHPPSATSSSPVTAEYIGSSSSSAYAFPQGPAVFSSADKNLHPVAGGRNKETSRSESPGAPATTQNLKLRQLSSPVSDNDETTQTSSPILLTAGRSTTNPIQSTRSYTSSPVTDANSDSKQHWMRQLLGQKSAPAIGQSPPNLTARPRHRSPKVIDDIDLQRSRTVPIQANKSQTNAEQTRGPESFNRVITDLEGLLQQALQIAGQANDDNASSGGLQGKTSPASARTTNRRATILERETEDESFESSDEGSSSDFSGLDEEQNRTTTSRQYADRLGNHITLVEPDEADRYRSQFKSHRHATPYPSTLGKPSENPSMSREVADESYDRQSFQRRSTMSTVPGGRVQYTDTHDGVTPQPMQITIQGNPADVQNVLLHPAGVTASSVDAADWALGRQATSATGRYPATTEWPSAPRKPSSAQVPDTEPQGFLLRERRPSKTPIPTEVTNASVYSGTKSFSSDDDKEPIAFFTDRPASELRDRVTSQRKRAVEKPALDPGLLPREDTIAPLPSDIGGLGPGSDPKSLDLKHRHHFSIREPKLFGLSRSHRRSPIARDWSTSKKRWVALVACINTALMGLIVGIYAGEVPAIQYNIVDEHHYTILGNVVLFIGLSITTAIFWPLPLLYGRKPFTLAALAILMPLQFPQAVTVSGYRTPYTPTYRIGLLLSRAVAGLVMGFANINFIATLLDLFGASLQSVNPHQEIVNVNDVRRHGGGMGIWLGIWTWCFIGSIGVGFFIGAVIISRLDVDWGFWITIILTAFVLVLNVLVPEVRRSPYRRSVAEVRTPTELSRRVARGEVKMHLYSTGPKWWIEEVIAGSVLCIRMLKQPGFLVLSVYIGWIYGQIVMVIVLLGALTSRYYRFRPQYVGLCVLAIPVGALLAVPFQRASVFSRARQKPPRTDSMTVNKRLTWTSHFVRRATFMISLPFAGLAYTLASVGPQVSVAAPTFFAGLIGFLSNLAIAECNGLIMETFDTSDLQPGMTGRPRRNLPEDIRKKRTHFSAFPRVTGAFAISQTCAFLIAAAATGSGGVIERRLGAQAATAVVAGILLILTLLLIAVVTRFKEIQIIPTQRYGTNVLSGPEDEWKPVIIGNPSGTTRRMSILELGGMTRWKEIRRRNRLTGLEGY